MDDLKDKKIAVVKDYAIHDLMITKYPEIELVLVKDRNEGFKAVSNGTVFAYIDNIAPILKSFQDIGYANIKIAGDTGHTLDIKIGVRNDWPLMLSAIQKALDTITAEERSDIYNKWIKLKYEKGFDYTLLWKIVAVFLIVLTAFIWWNRTLSEQIKKRVAAEAALNIAKDEAERANQAKSSFLANMSHEIRTPMNAILGFTEILKNKIDNPQFQNYLNNIWTSGKALLSLINDILDLSKVEAGKMSIEFNPFSIKEMLDEIKTLFWQKIEAKGLDFIIEVQENFPDMIVLDETRLRQILINIVGNGVKFTEKGYVKLVVNFEFSPHQDNALNIFFAVEDTGIGIEADQMEKIFEAFEQQKGQRTSKYGGTGLGLTISKKLAEMMGGTITVSSTQGKGSRFVVSIKKVEFISVDSNHVVRENTLKTASVVFKKSTILIADDIDYNIELIKGFLEGFDFTFIEAADGKDALEKVWKYNPSLILLDIKMPVMNGDEVAKILKKDEKFKTIPIIAVTASVMEDEKNLIKKLCDGFLKKPIERNTLVNELMKFIPYKSESLKNNDNFSLGTNIAKIEIPPIFREKVSAELDYFQQIFDEKAIDKIEEFAQKIKSDANNNNLPELYKLGEELYEAAGRFDSESIRKILNKFKLISGGR